MSISASTIENLSHDLDEIRIRTLKHIEGKILRAFQQDSLIEFNSGKLISKLIGWFNKKPLLEVEAVLNLILNILKSEHAHETIKYLKKERIEKEILKIYEIVKSSSHYREIVQSIKSILENYQEPEKYIETSSSDIPQSVSSSSDIASIHDISSDNNEFLNEYEVVWSTPSLPDLNTLNLLYNSISTISTFEEIRNGLVFFKTVVNDYPAEYFLQPPYIFLNLVKLYFKEKTFAKLLISNLTYLSKALICRTQKRITSECYDPAWKENLSDKYKTQITISRFCIEVLKICVEHLKEFNESTIDQSEIFHAYQLIIVIFDVMELKEFKKSPKISLKSILIDLGRLARIYRREKNIRDYRIQYILIIYIIAKLTQQEKFYMNINIYSTYNNKNSNMESLGIWCSELQYAILDFPLQNLHPEIYREIKKAIDLENTTIPHIKNVLNCQNNFNPAIEILKKPDGRKDEEFILLALKALDTLSIHRSLSFVKKLIQVISRSMYLFYGNLELKSAAEEIILRLLAHENFSISRVTYREIANNMKQSFGALMNGCDTNNRSFNSQFERPRSLGVPLTLEIISEIICFGYLNEDISINKNSEIILSLILKGKDVLGVNWKNILEILIPNLPLLQCLASFENSFGKLIFEIFNPDNELESSEIMKGNLRFLFSYDDKIRSEAITRLAYVVSKDSTNNEFLPNVFEIFDTIPNNLCCIQIPRDPEKIFYGGLYDSSTIPALLELLKSDDVEPNIRKTCLMQLNVLCQDLDLNKMIFNDNGWFYTIQALENALKKTPNADYPDTAVPAISMLCKLVLCNSFFRKELSNESSIYVLLLRALFLFYNDITLQQDAVITLFLLLYSHHIVGAEKHISVPKILQKINLPLKCEFHWQKSNFRKSTSIEEIFLELSENNQNCKNIIDTKTGPLSRRSEPLYSIARDKNLNDNYASLLQYIRFSFAASWYSSFDAILQIKSTSLRNDNVTLDYSIFPGHFKENTENFVEISDILEFNHNLKMNAEDIRLIKITSTIENFKKFLKKIINATNENDFLINFAGLRFCLLLGAHNFLDGNEILKIYQRFLTVKPSSSEDYKIFENSIEFFEYLVKKENEIIICWLLNEFSEQYCLILQILKEFSVPNSCYEAICKLIETLIKFCSKNHLNNKIKELILHKKEKNSEGNYYNLYNKLFEYLIPITEECFHKRYIEQLRCLLNLLQIITEIKCVEIDLGYVYVVIKKFMYFMMALKLFNQGGSHLIKNCLLIIGNLMTTVDELLLEENHIKLLSGLCSHEDFEVRALSWCILKDVAAYLNGAHLIVKELSYLPGGFHACCLSTFLDTNEIPIVRSTAGMLFANLLSHRIKNSEEIQLHLSVVPLCIEVEPSIQNKGLYLIRQIFSKHRFYSAILNSIEHIHIGNTIDCFKVQDITTCTIMKAYCRILNNFISLIPENAVEEFDNEPFMIKIFNLIKLIPSNISSESLSMMCEICFLINKLNSIENIRLVKKNLCGDYGFIVALIQLLNLKYFENGNTDLLVNMLQTLKLLVNETISFEIICEILSSNGTLHLIEILIYGLKENNNLDLQNICLKLLISLFVKSENISTEKYKTIPVIFDTLTLTNELNETLSGSEQIFISIKSIFIRVFQKKREGYILKKTMICEALAIILRTSEKCRKFAHKENFLTEILDQIGINFENITTCTEYIRKYGDSKKEAILQELTILFSIILHWFYKDCLTHESQIEKLSKIALQTWQWINHSKSLREVFLKTLAVLSKDSLKVCKQFSASITSFSNSIIQLTSKMVIAETNKIKHPNIDFGILEIGLGILTNCCGCIEGRLLMVKMNLLDVITNLYPIDMKYQKSWYLITMYWLEFWNIFSRYQEGAVIKHLYILCSLIVKSRNKIRIICLKILRNMAFIQINRPALLASQDFQYIVKEILENGNVEEKYIVIVTLWKISAENSKAKHILKNWGVVTKLKNVQRENDAESDLNSTIDIVLDILK